MSTRISFSVLGGLLLGAGLFNCSLSGGTYEDGPDAAPTCDTAKCAAGNECIEDQGVTECRLTCDTQRGATGCPTNYTCASNGSRTFCKADKNQPTPRAGQYGAACTALQGVNAEECDYESGFYCQFNDRNDPNAFCTRYDCESDADCTGGYFCGSANDIPFGAKEKRVIGATHKACLPRTFCSPCETDLDCAPDNGVPQFCERDVNGAGYCTKECSKDTNCNDEAACVDGLCAPIAQVCVGDGSFCSPCRSDADCATGGGACVKSRYSTEKTCTVPSKKKCDITGETAVFDCPTDMPALSPARSFVSCVGQVFSEVPVDQCSGLVPLGKTEDDGVQVGCFGRLR